MINHLDVKNYTGAVALAHTLGTYNTGRRCWRVI